MKKVQKILFLILIITMLAGCTVNTTEQEEKNKSFNESFNRLREENRNKQTTMSARTADPSVQLTTEEVAMNKAVIKTSMGEITLEFYSEDAPKTVENFKKLAKQGFYNNVIFHRVINNFMIQGGDPTGTGMGGPGYTFPDEINKESALYKTGYKKGIVAMANAGPNTNGSQFFIMHADYPLPPAYTIFGRVVEGQDVVDKIATIQTDANDRPLNPVVINAITIKQ